MFGWPMEEEAKEFTITVNCRLLDAMSCPGWVIFQSVESPNSRLRLGNPKLTDQFGESRQPCSLLARYKRLHLMGSVPG
jgi:hypothetical protein